MMLNAPVSVPVVAGPHVVRQVILKLNSRCNLSCRYCYVYHSVDEGWRRQPVTMASATIAAVARRIGEHVEQHGLAGLGVVLHGGEPLLAGHATVEEVLSTIRSAVPERAAVHFSIQTNGILLDRSFLDIFDRFGVRVGVSLDGDEQANDRHRTYVNGSGSYGAVVRGLDLLNEECHRERFGGLLCTIDVRNDPAEVFAALSSFQPPAVDLLLPHGNWTNPPPRPAGAPTYAEWLVRVFDLWYDAPDQKVAVRLFESIIGRILNRPSATEAIGGDLPGVLTVETDGSYEQSDALKTTVDGGAATGLTAARHSFDDVLAHLAVTAPPVLAEDCRRCPIVTVCGGGLRAHRFRAENLFDNPSVYCADLLALITHIDRRVRQDMVDR